MAKVRVGYFLEDIAHEKFITALVKRIAEDIGMRPDTLEFVAYNASGGKGKVMTELRHFLRDVQRGHISSTPVLIVTLDGNCQGYTDKYNEVTKLVNKYDYAGKLVCAIPAPHIERWYIADPAGLQSVLDAPKRPDLPTYKCERARYKQAILDVFSSIGVRPLLGGAEYGKDIVAIMDLYTAQQADSALKHFVDHLKAALSPFV